MRYEPRPTDELCPSQGLGINFETGLAGSSPLRRGLTASEDTSRDFCIVTRPCSRCADCFRDGTRWSL